MECCYEKEVKQRQMQRSNFSGIAKRGNLAPFSTQREAAAVNWNKGGMTLHWQLAIQSRRFKKV